jgi:chromosome transmission fidelity protein 4
MLNDKKIAGAAGFSSNATITRNTPVLTTHAALPSKFVQNGKKLMESALPTPNPSNQENCLIEREPKKPKGEARGTTGSAFKVSSPFTPLTKVPKNSETKKDKTGVSNAIMVDQNKKGGMDQTGAKKMSTEDCNRTGPQRPVNPFAKSSSSKEHSPSLLDSIKKMNVETEKVEKPNSKKVKV